MTESAQLSDTFREAQQEEWQERMEEYSQARQEALNTIGHTGHQVKSSSTTFTSSSLTSISSSSCSFSTLKVYIEGSGGGEREMSATSSYYLGPAGWQWWSS